MPGRALLASVALALALAGCGGGDDAAEPRLAVSRADGSTVDTGRTLRAWCGVPPHQGEDAPLSLHVLQGDEVGALSYLLFRAAVELLETTPRVELPRQPADSVTFALFVNDRERDNEAADVPEGGEGSVEVERWGCDRGDEVAITVDALLASEVGGDPILVTGSVTAEIGEPPEGYEP